MVTSHLCAQVEDRFEKFARQFVLAILTVLGRDLIPSVGDENDAPQGCVTTKSPEHAEIPSGYSGKPFISDEVDIYDTGKLAPLLVSVKRFSPED